MSLPKPLRPETSTLTSWKNFLKLEPYIATIIAEFPKTITFHPKDLAPSSFKTYLRSAMLAFCHEDCRWPASFTKERVMQLFEQGLSIQDDKGRNLVTVSCREFETKAGVDLVTLEVSDTISASDEDVVLAIALLKDRELIRNPVSFTLIPPELAAKLTSRFGNITLSTDPSSPSITTMF